MATNHDVDLAAEASEDEPANKGLDPLEEEKREKIRQEIMKLEDEINTLKQALNRKERRLSELRFEIGETRWAQIKQGLGQKYQTVQSSAVVNKSKQALSGAGQKASETLKSLGTATANKWTQLRESERFQSAGEKFWSATGAVKAKITGENPQKQPEASTAAVAGTADKHPTSI